jgi:hypothetical protein
MLRRMGAVSVSPKGSSAVLRRFFGGSSAVLRRFSGARIR